MTPIGIIFLLVNAIALLAVPRRWAPLPLLVGVCYMTAGQQFAIGSLTFTIARALVVVGIFRALIRSEGPVGGFSKLDGILVVWGLWGMFASVFHESFSETVVGNGRLVLNTLGTYFLIRCFIRTPEDLLHNLKLTGILLAPLALEMVQEQLTGRNLFSVFGGVPEFSTIRGDRLRANGPFAHGILAGTVGAVSLPLMLPLLREHRRIALIGISACVVMVLASVSSGPIMSLLFSLFALVLWRFRGLMKLMKWGAVAMYIALDLVMKAPAYYIIARIDLTGSSTGWHRAELIKQAIAHLPEWWKGGTDYTRHWMPTGVTWSPDHCDITNHYIGYGMIGGFLFMALFIIAIFVAFNYVGAVVRDWEELSPEIAQLAWCLGASLFAHTASMVSVYYFDQSIAFVYICLGFIGSLRLGMNSEEIGALADSEEASPSHAMTSPLAHEHGI
ncbi:MAG: hypothetical protein IT580_13320 [Verrucomicrobiales bacterium]|nr:hypothetical protein [Verrucomicrobiales bacterium]